MASEQLMMYIVGTGLRAVGMGVGAVTDARIRPWSRARVLGCPLAWGKGFRHAARAFTVDILVIALWSEG